MRIALGNLDGKEIRSAVHTSPRPESGRKRLSKMSLRRLQGQTLALGASALMAMLTDGVGAIAPALAETAKPPEVASAPAPAAVESHSDAVTGSVEGAVPMTADVGPYLALIDARSDYRAGDVALARQKLGRLVAANPTFLPAILAGARLDTQRSPRGFLHYLNLAWRGFQASFLYQSVLLNRAIWWIFGTLLAAATLLALAHATTTLAPLHHLLYERLAPGTSGRLASTGAAILLLLPFVWGLGLLGGSLVLVALSARQGLPHNRRLLALGTAALVAACVVPAVLPAYLAAPDFRDDAFVLAAAEHGTLARTHAERLGQLTKDHPGAALVLGTALARSGDLERAEQLFARYASHNPEEPATFVALGNLHARRGEPGRAMALYERAVALDPQHFAATYNLALANAALLRFEESNRLLGLASEIDFAALRAARELSDGDARPVEPQVPAKLLWDIHRATATGRGIPVPEFMRIFLPWRGGRLWPAALVLIAAAAFLSGPLWKWIRTFPCSICARTVCRRCVRRARSRIFCRSCSDDVANIPSVELMQILAKQRRTRVEVRTRWRKTALDLVLPGSALWRNGRPGLALAAALCLTGGLTAWLVPHLVPMLPPAAEFFRFSILRLVPLVCVVIGYVAAIAWGYIIDQRRIDVGLRGRLIPLSDPHDDGLLELTGTGG